MTFEEVKKLVGQCEVVHLEPNAQYLFICDPVKMSMAAYYYMKKELTAMNVKCVFVWGKEDAMRIFKIDAATHLPAESSSEAG